jgi:hypothetical protein
MLADSRQEDTTRTFFLKPFHRGADSMRKETVHTANFPTQREAVLPSLPHTTCYECSERDRTERSRNLSRDEEPASRYQRV